MIISLKMVDTCNYMDSRLAPCLHFSQVCQWLLPAFVSGPTMAGRDDSSRLDIKRCVTWDPPGGATLIFAGWFQVRVLMWFWTEGSRADVTIARKWAIDINYIIDHVLNPERTPDSKGHPHSTRNCMIGRLLLFWALQFISYFLLNQQRLHKTNNAQLIQIVFTIIWQFTDVIL